MCEEFKVGDVVHLNSNQIPMTISSVSTLYGVHCFWHGENWEIYQEYFKPEMLTKKEEK